MNFKTKKIRKKITRKKIKPTIKLQRKGNQRKTIKIKINPILIASLTVILFLTLGIAKTFKSIDYSVILKTAGTELKTDGYGHTNFLILGTGGKYHDGGNLTDTIMVASIDPDNKKITMFSIPRDLYIKDDLIGNAKINENYYRAKINFDDSTKGLEHVSKKIEEITGIPIHYYVKIDFDGFKELIDVLGGIEVDVKKDIYDPQYPLDGTYKYQTFSIKKGIQQLDGETALKFARSRKSTSDFDRAERQQQIIFAIKEKATQSSIIFSINKIKEILQTLNKNIETNIKANEILTLGSMISDYKEDQIKHTLIHDDPTQCGGLLYTPSREYYNNMFVLIPAGGMKFIHRFADLSFNNSNITPQNTKLHILNGTPTVGIAGETKGILQRYCFNVIRYGNATNKNTEKTTYYYKQKYDENGTPTDEKPPALHFLQKIIPGKETTEIPEEYKEYIQNADIIIVIGKDYANSNNYIEDPFYSLPMLKTTTTEDETTTETTTTSTTETVKETIVTS